MVRYIKLFSEFTAFLNENIQEFTTDTDIKFLNLLIENFEAVAETGTVHGKRAKLINSLIQKHGSSVSSKIEIEDSSVDKNKFPFVTLKTLFMENFRGFSQPEQFTFDKQFAFIYGPNGSGKSSLCEAIEYSLLGYINEAISKNIDINDYIKNSVTGQSNPPKLIGLASGGDEIEITKNQQAYNFLFVEKGRIENFSRISSNSPTKRQNLIATLFGLDKFNEFVNNFTDKIENYIDVKGIKNVELSRKNETIKVHKENISKAKNELLDIEKEKQTILQDLKLEITFNELDELIHKPDSGKLALIEKELLKPSKSKISVKLKNEIERAIVKITSLLEKFTELNQTYTNKKDKVQFKDLYAATLEIEVLIKDKCPVCFTPIEDTTEHPYDNARIKLHELKEISDLEIKRATAFSLLQSELSELSSILVDRYSKSSLINFQKEKIEYNISISDGINENDIIIREYNEFIVAYNKSQDGFEEYDRLVAAHNSAADSELKEKEALGEKQKNLKAISDKITNVKTRTKVIQNNLTSWNKSIDEFAKENAELIKQVELEKSTVVQNIAFASSYAKFIKHLEGYNERLPLKHLEDLSNLTLEIYNIVNSHDNEFETVSRIKLPTSTDDDIRIWYDTDPENNFDALQILSEGHIRCLGLSILLAKNIHDDCPLIIFDDIVNAIDSDHQGGVRKVIFEYKPMASKQIILTTHSESFIKELEQHPSRKDYEKLVSKVSLSQDESERKIRIKLNSYKNYLIQASQFFGNADYSEALYNCRCALENISQKIWSMIDRKGYKTEFSVMIRSPKHPPDLMSVVLALNIFIKSKDVGDKLKSLTENFDYIVGLEEHGNVIWSYLNKGTHEEEGRPDFDPLTIKDILRTINEIDKKLKSK